MTIKKVKLGVREFDIPELALRQRRVVVPLGMKLANTMMRIKQEKSIASLTTEEYEDIQRTVWAGCTRGQPKLEWEAFQDFVIDEIDLINAYSVVISQAGFEARGEQTGEASGAAATPNSPRQMTNGESTMTT